MKDVSRRRGHVALPALVVTVVLLVLGFTPGIAGAVDPPDAPRNVTATAGYDSITISWDAPTVGGPDFLYFVTGTDLNGAASVSGQTRSLSFGFDVVPGHLYEFVVVPFTVTGDFQLPGQPSTPVRASTLQRLAAASITEFGVRPLGARIAFTRTAGLPADAIAAVSVFAPNGDENVVPAFDGSPIEFSAPLDPAETYTVRVAWYTANCCVERITEFSDPITFSPLPAVNPPTDVVATTIPGGIGVTWTAPEAGGTAAVSFTALAVDDAADEIAASTTVPLGSTSAQLSGLIAGQTYRVVVAADSSFGEFYGGYSESVFAVAGSGNVLPVPETTIVSGPADGAVLTTRSTSFSFAASPVAGATFTCAVDDGSSSPCTSPFSLTDLADGNHTFSVVASNSSGSDPTPATRTFTVAADAPETTITSAPQGFSAAPSIAFSSSVTGSTFRCAVNGGPATPCTSPFEPVGLVEGTTTVSVVATSSSGIDDPTPATTTFVYDATAPVVTITQPVVGARITVGQTVDTEFSCVDAADPNPSCAIVTPIDTATAGTGRTFEVRGTDAAGNTRTATRTYDVVANGAPTATLQVDSTAVVGDLLRLSLVDIADDSGVASLLYAFDCGFGDGFGPAVPVVQWACFPVPDTAELTVRARVFDTEGGETSLEQTVEVVEPLTVSLPDVEGIEGSTVTLTATVQGGKAPYVFSWPNSISQASTFDIVLFDGGVSPTVYSIPVTVTDAAGRTATGEATITSANAAPSLSLSTSTPVVGGGQPVRITASYTDPGRDTRTGEWRCPGGAVERIDALDYGDFFRIDCTAPGAPGVYEVTAQVFDDDGGASGVQTITFEVIGAPETALSGWQFEEDIATRTPQFTFGSPTAGATFECAIDGGSYAACTSPYTAAPLSEAQHTFSVRAVNAVGVDPTPSIATFVVDVTAPVITITTPTEGQQIEQGAQVSWNAEGSDARQFNCVPSGDLLPTGYLDTRTVGRDRSFTFTCTDRAGNQSTATTHFDVVEPAPPVVDTVIVSGPAEGSTVSSAVIAFTTSPTTPGMTFICTVNGASQPCGSTDGSGLIVVSGPDGPYAVTVAAATDPTPATRSFVLDTTAPTTTITSAPTTSTSTDATVTFTADDRTATFSCSWDGGAYTTCTSPQTRSGLALGPHTFAVRAVDGAGNVEATPVSASWTVTTQLQIIISPLPEATVGASYERTLLSTGGVSPVAWSVVDGALPPGMELRTNGTLTGDPTAAGTYNFTVEAADAVGQTARASFQLVVNGVEPDTTITGGPAEGSLQSSRSVTYTFASDTSGATFECRVDAAAFGPCTTTTSHTASNLSDGTHTFEVRAVVAGSVDATPARRTVTIDATAPTVAITTPTLNAVYAIGDQVTPQFTCSDGTNPAPSCTAVAGVGPDGRLTTSAAGTVDLVVRAVDAAGNTSTATVRYRVQQLTVTFTATPDSKNPNTSFRFDTGGIAATFQCTVVNSSGATVIPTGPCSSPYGGAKNLAPGTYTLRVRATSANGPATAEASSTWTVIAKGKGKP